MRFHVITFGCQMNVCDSDWIRGTLTDMGWDEADEESAEVFIVNTCSVREKPELKVYSMLGRLKALTDKSPRAFAAVGGCVAQQVGAEILARFPHVRLVFGTDSVTNVPQALRRLVSEPGLKMSLLDFIDRYPERPSPESASGAVQAFVNIMQGCDNFCAYCIVPYVRGRQKSREAGAVLKECRDLAARGVREITLLGQNVNSYGQDLPGDAPGFADLLRRVAAIKGVERLRFTTSHPKDISPEVVAAFGELENLCPSLHLPLQSGSDRVLRVMGRKYDRARYLDIVARLKEARPDIALTTDIIVGFPGETDQDFAETMSMLDEVGYEGSFSFKYSDRPGVRAERMSPKVDEAVKGERLKILQARQDELTAAAYAARVGETCDVLFESRSKKQAGDATWYRGRDAWGRVVNAPAPLDSPEADGLSGGIENDLTGRLARVIIQIAKKHSLSGKLVGEP